MNESAIQLFPYQKQWIRNDARFKIGMFARQTGKTFTTTLEIVDDCFICESQGKRTRWIVLSRGERQSKEAMEEVKKHCQAYQFAIDLFETDYRTDDLIVKQLEAVLPGGSRIIALPANPDTARGFSGNVFLDEFAFHQDSRKIWSALFPVISAGYKLRVTSTPNGKANKFYDLITMEQGKWSKHVVDIYQAVADGLDRDVNELRKNLNDEDAWAQEYELKWLDEASAWLSFDLINSVEHEQAGIPERYQNNPVYIGNDIARRNDLWVAWVLEPVGDVFWTREVIVKKRISFAEQDAILDELFRKYRVARLCIDQTGMGEKPVEDAKRRYGKHRTEGVVFTSNSKLTMATIAKQIFEDKRIRLPMGDTALRTDLHSLKKIDSPTGAPRFIADESDGHADRAWACFLALYAAQNPSNIIEFKSVGRRASVGSIHRTANGFGTVSQGTDLNGY